MRGSDVGHDNQSATLEALARVVVLCNRAEFKAGQDGVPIVKRYASYTKFRQMSRELFKIQLVKLSS